MQNSKVKIAIQNLKIIANERFKNKYCKIIVNAPEITRIAQPGQFLQVKVGDGYEPLLRRPLSIHRVSDSNIEILYEVVGTGTEVLSKKKAGEYLDTIGPLGNGFKLTTHNSQLTTILVAGGMGVAPLLFLAEIIKKYQSIKASKYQSIVLIGAKTKSQILCEKEFQKLGCQVKIATDDGSRGFKGKVTELLKNKLASGFRLQVSGLKPVACSLQPTVMIYACGPRAMLKEIAFISQHNNILAQASLEEHMACGIGACLGCVVKTKDGYKRVCKEGPIFNVDKIIW